MISHRVPVACATLALVACAAACSTAPLSDSVGLGPDPVLPVPAKAFIPTVNVAPAVGWAQDARPRAAAGMTVNVFANGLDHPRWLHVLPNGDVLVAETNAPPQPADEKGIKNRVMGYFMKKAGAGTPSANRITLLRDTDGDGAADMRVAFPYRPGQQHIDGDGVKVIDLPAGPRNHHWTKGLIASV
ncbi:MAG: sorbosone dehydrogenase family protein, partial [Proteobacteria bacterium]|nr:sorbosone dehydrogenase family protein [Pseudomonadota bacterium]